MWHRKPSGRSLSARRRWLPLVVTCSALLLACEGSGGEAERLNQEANQLYRGGSHQQSLDTYLRAAVERPDLTEINYNAGNALHQLGQFERAVRESQRAAAAGDNETRFRAYYSLGNHFARQEKWREAFESYRNALVLEPGEVDAKHNLEVALSHLIRQERERQAREQQQAQEGGDQPGQGQGQQGQGQGQQGQPGDGGQQAGQGQQPGQGQGQQPGQGQGQPGGAAGGGAPTPGTGAPASGAAARAASERELEAQLAELERQMSVAQALKVLDALAEQNRLQRGQIPGPPPGSNIRDQ